VLIDTGLVPDWVAASWPDLLVNRLVAGLVPQWGELAASSEGESMVKAAHVAC